MSILIADNNFNNIKFYINSNDFSKFKLINSSFYKNIENNYIKITIDGEFSISNKENTSLIEIKPNNGCVVNGKIYDAAFSFCGIILDILNRNNSENIVCFTSKTLLFTASKINIKWNYEFNNEFDLMCNRILKLLAFG